MNMWNWDYNLPEHWQPTDDQSWEWYLIRKLNHYDFTDIPKEKLYQYFPSIEQQLDPGINLLIKNYFDHYGINS